MSEDNQNPIKIARKLGAYIGDNLGEKALQELELAFVNSILSRLSDNPYIRMRQHCLFHWDQSYLKSTLLDKFYDCLPDTIEKLNFTTNPLKYCSEV